MSPVIRISDATYERLQNIARPFVDTPAIVIERLLDKYEANGVETSSDTNPSKDGQPQTKIVHLDPNSPESLSHTRVRRAVFDYVEIDKPKWNNLIRVGHEIAIEKLGSYATLAKVTTAHVVKGKYEEDGFTYLSDQDISVQGLSANSAWEKSLHLAKNLQVPIRVEFEWRNRPEAAHPGTGGVLQWLPED
ncbi:MAG: T4SS efffector SepA family protein [Rubrobacteraceae bacterium]